MHLWFRHRRRSHITPVTFRNLKRFVSVSPKPGNEKLIYVCASTSVYRVKIADLKVCCDFLPVFEWQGLVRGELSPDECSFHVCVAENRQELTGSCFKRFRRDL